MYDLAIETSSLIILSPEISLLKLFKLWKILEEKASKFCCFSNQCTKRILSESDLEIGVTSYLWHVLRPAVLCYTDCGWVYFFIIPSNLYSNEYFIVSFRCVGKDPLTCFFRLYRNHITAPLFIFMSQEGNCLKSIVRRKCFYRVLQTSIQKLL